MWQGNRRLIEQVDDWAGVDFKDIIIDEVLLPITFIEEPLPTSFTHVYGVEIKKGDMIWVSKDNATDLITELEEFGCEFKVTYRIEDSSLVGLFITKVPNEVEDNGRID